MGVFCPIDGLFPARQKQPAMNTLRKELDRHRSYVFCAFPEDARWNADRQAAEFGGRRVPRRGPGAAGVLGCSGNGTMISPFFTAGQTVSAHGFYLVLVALILFLAPELVRLILPAPAALDWWTRLLALPLLNLGILCVGVGRAGSLPLVKLTVAVRLGVLPALAALVGLGLAPMIVLGVGVIDMVSAALTLWGLAAPTRPDA
jgi:hypothetical protein